jgi:hypothetical protein
MIAFYEKKNVNFLRQHSLFEKNIVLLRPCLDTYGANCMC